MLGQHAGNLREKAEKENTAESWNNLAEYLYQERTDPGLIQKATGKAIELATSQNNRKELGRAYIYSSEISFQEGDILKFREANRTALQTIEGLRYYDLEEEALNNMATAFGEQDQIDSLIFYVRQAIDLNLRYKGSKKQLGNEYQNLAYSYSILGVTDSSLFYTRKTIEVLGEAKDTLRMLDAYNQLAVIHVKSQQYKEALNTFNEALDLYEKVENKHNRLYIYTNLAALFQKWGKQEQAIDFSRKAIADAANSSEKITYAKLLCNLGGHLYRHQLYQSSIDTLTLALPYIRESHYYLGTAYQTLAANYFAINKADSVTHYLALTDSLSNRNQFTRGELFYAAKAGLLLEQGKIKEAVPYVYEFIQTDSRKELKDAYPALYNMVAYILEEGAGDYKQALAYKSLAYAIQDSLYKKESDSRLNEFYALYKTTEKELEISRLNEERQKILYTRTLLISCFVIIAVILLCISLYNRFLRLKKEKEAVSLAAKVKELEIRQMQQYLEGLEDERNRLAKDLHDHVSNNLYILDNELKKIENIPPAVSRQMGQLYHQVRNISHELISPAFQYTTLAEIVHSRIVELNEKSTIRFTLALPEEAIIERLPVSVSHELYRIVQECIGNILKYSRATEAKITLSYENQKLFLTVQDNGTGFDPEKKRTGIGLQIIEERTKRMNGSLSIASGPGNGCQIKVMVPFILPDAGE